MAATKGKQWVNVSYFVLAIGLLSFSSALWGVSQQHVKPTNKASGRGIAWVTSDLAFRAQSDVQMRRLLQLFAAQQLDSEDFYNELQKIRQSRADR